MLAMGSVADTTPLQAAPAIAGALCWFLHDRAVWGLGKVLTVAPPSLGNLPEGQVYLPLAPGGISQWPFHQAGHPLTWPWNQLFLWNQPLCLVLGPGYGAG